MLFRQVQRRCSSGNLGYIIYYIVNGDLWRSNQHPNIHKYVQVRHDNFFPLCLQVPSNFDQHISGEELDHPLPAADRCAEPPHQKMKEARAGKTKTCMLNVKATRRHIVSLKNRKTLYVDIFLYPIIRLKFQIFIHETVLLLHKYKRPTSGYQTKDSYIIASTTVHSRPIYERTTHFAGKLNRITKEDY